MLHSPPTPNPTWTNPHTPLESSPKGGISPSPLLKREMETVQGGPQGPPVVFLIPRIQQYIVINADVINAIILRPMMKIDASKNNKNLGGRGKVIQKTTF